MSEQRKRRSANGEGPKSGASNRNKSLSLDNLSVSSARTNASSSSASTITATSASKPKSTSSKDKSSLNLPNNTSQTRSSVKISTNLKRAKSKSAASMNGKLNSNVSSMPVASSVVSNNSSGKPTHPGGIRLDRQLSRKKSNGSAEKINGNSFSHDRVRRIVEEEGRSARNLIAYNVPAVDEASKGSMTRAVPRSPRKKSARDMSPMAKKADDACSIRSTGSRPASSAGSQILRKTDVRARYWAFLFDNLKRAVDEIYQTCETDESIDECKEVIMILQQCTKDFQSLINQWNVIKAFEHLEESGQRPASLAWEVRKTSPGKLHLNKDQGGPGMAAAAALLRSPRPPSSQNQETNTSSWAELVKGPITVDDLEMRQIELLRSEESPQPPTAEPPINTLKPEAIKPDLDAGDVDGWETVRRSRSKVSPLSKASSSSKGSISSTGNSKHDKFNRNGAGDASNNSKRVKTTKLTNKAKFHKPVTNEVSKSVEAVSSSEEKRGSYRDVVMNAKTSNRSEKISNSVTNGSSILKKVSPPSTNGSIEPQLSTEKKIPTPRRLELDDIQVTNSTSAPLTEESFDTDQTINKDELKLDLRSAVVDSDAEEYLAMELEEALSTALEDDDLTEQEAALESVLKEEEGYLRQIEQAEKEQYLPDNDDMDDPELNNAAGSQVEGMSLSATSLDWETLKARYEIEAERRKTLGINWADIVDAESRTPGRGAHMHEKLSSPSRKRSITESKKRHEEKQAKAAELRERYMTEKTEKIKDLTKKVEEIRLVKEDLMKRKKNYLSRKLQEAEEKRQMQLMKVVKKAHEEENKANEIAFINSLSEQNKKMDIMTKHLDVEARLQDIEDERQRKIGEKAAKEAAVEERRKALDAERLARLNELQMKRKKREEEIEQKNMERDKERTEALKNKEREHKDRLAQIERQQQANIEELQKKIEYKQNESTRRHNEQLQSKREKAFIMNILKHSTEDHSEAPKLEPYETMKMCTVCLMSISSEVHLQSHLRGQQHQQKLKEKQRLSGSSMSKDDIECFNLEHIQDVPADYVDPKEASIKERSKSLKKRCKKLKQRMQARGNEYEAGLELRQETVDSSNKAKLNKLIKDVNKFMQSQEKGPWPQNKVTALDRSLGEIVRVLDKKDLKDQIAFKICGGLNTLVKLLLLLNEEVVCSRYPKTMASASQAIRLACKGNFENSHYILFSNRIGTLVDLLMSRLNNMSPDLPTDISDTMLGSTTDSNTLSQIMTQVNEPVDLNIDPCATALVHTLAAIFSCLAQTRLSEKSSPRPGADAFSTRINDIVSYVITVGVVDKFQSLYSKVRGTLDENTKLPAFLQHSISFLTNITKLTAKKQHDVFEETPADCTTLMQTYEDIELAGIMSLLYGMLLHNVPSRGETATPPELPTNTLTVTLAGLKLVNQIATMNYKLVQRVLGAEWIALELRHIVSYLIWYCTHYKNEELLHEVILCIGYFVVLNADNQMIVQSGQSPTILQQLCSLPFQYFSDPRLVHILFPCIIACCYKSGDNMHILENELSSDLLANFIEESQLAAQQEKTSSAQKRPVGMNQPDNRMSLAYRFPQNLWTDAKEYFSTKL